MGYISATFIGKKYSIPEDVLLYTDLLEFTEDIKKQLVNAFMLKVSNELQKGNTGCLDDGDLSFDIEQQVGRLIAKLCDNGIFTRTINDYLRQNKGYQLISDVNKAALEAMKSLLIREMESWKAGYTDAVIKKEASVTGIGFSIWSSSFVNHAIYAAMEASAVSKQEKAAAVQYQKDMNQLKARLDAQYGGEKGNYINNTYIPSMETALTVFAYELLDKYIADLIANGKFDRKALDYVDIGRSNDLLKNLTLSNNKQAVLENAFVACPYNVAVYMQAVKYELLDFDSFQTAKVFKQHDLILSFLNESWGEASFPTKFSINYYCIDIWASFTGKTSIALLHSLTNKYVSGIIKAYSRVAEILANKQLCRKTMEDCSEDAILAGDAICKAKAHSYVDTIVSSAIWNQLTEKCGHVNLLIRIKELFSLSCEISNKDDLDRNIITQLYARLESERINLISEINKRREEETLRKAEQEQIEQKRKKRNRTLIAVISPVLVATVAFIIVLYTVIIPSNKYKQALELYNNEEYQAAIEAFSEIEGYKDSGECVVDCKYSFAVKLYGEGNYTEAKSIFTDIQGYKDATRWMCDCYMQLGDYQSAIQAYGSGSIVIPEGITHIEAEAFKDCEMLTDITIPGSVKSIGKDAFYKCNNLRNVNISDLESWCTISLETWSSSPMLYGDNLYLNGELLTDIVVPDNLTKINEYTFSSWDCLVNVQIGDNITDIESSAFSCCNNLKSVTLPNTITKINSDTFSDCSSLTDLFIPVSVNTIGEDAFSNCDSLINVVIPNNVECIEASAFAHCDNLTTFSFPDGIKTIAGYMFYLCESLQTVKVPNSVSSIGKWAFRNCLKLTSIEFNGTISEWKSINKEEEWDCEIGQYTVYCTDGQISAAQNAIFECEAGDVITFGTYEQDGNSNNGAEAIEWIVLERDGSKAFVLSLYCLEQKPFNNTLAPVTWENCSLRKWLNGTFLDIAFSQDEQDRIVLSTISNYEEGTTDKVFLLSENEVDEYLTYAGRQAEATESVSTDYCYWFLRTPAGKSNIAYVSYDGEVGYWENVDRNWWIRPAMWIEIDT